MAHEQTKRFIKSAERTLVDKGLFTTLLINRIFFLNQVSDNQWFYWVCHCFLCYLLMTDRSMYCIHSNKCFLSFSFLHFAVVSEEGNTLIMLCFFPKYCWYITWPFWQCDILQKCLMNVWKLHKHKSKEHPPSPHPPLCSCTPMSSYVKTKHLPVYHLTIGTLGGAGFESFEVNLSWEICITGARRNHRLKINCFALLQTSFWLCIREWTFCNACCQLYTHLHARALRKSGKYYTFTFMCGYKNTDAYKCSYTHIHLQMYKMTV